MTNEEIDKFISSNYRKIDGYVSNNGGKYGHYIIAFKNYDVVDVVMSKQQRSQLWRTKISKNIYKVSHIGYVNPK